MCDKKKCEGHGQFCIPAAYGAMSRPNTNGRAEPP